MGAAPQLPWPAGAATGIGSLPGTDPVEAVRLVFGELPELPHLPELPARGPGADAVGRTAAALVDLHVDLQPAGWRLVTRAGLDERRAQDLLARDLDALEEVAGDYTGPLKLALVGPWTLAATLELTRGERAVSDPGAVRDLTGSLAAAVSAHVAALRRRVPGASVLVQLDEPGLPGVLAGALPTASGFGRLRAVEGSTARDALATVLAAAVDAGGWPLVHCCAGDVPFRLLAQAGARAVSVDATTLDPRHDDTLGELLEGGTALLLGLVPALGPGVAPTPSAAAAPARALWARLGLPPQQLGELVVATPACGLAGASSGWARTALRLVRQVGRVLVEAPEDGGG